MAILVVDDSRAMRLIVRRELRKAGYEEIVEAENGADALQTIQAGDIDLVLSDWNMPDMNGIELLTALRGGGSAVAFGFITSETNDDIRMRAFEGGANFMVTKPFNGDELSREVRQLLGGAAGGQGGQATSGASDTTVPGVLEGLVGRPVVATDSEPPLSELHCAVAVYTDARDGRNIYCVFEMPLAASVGSALSMIPATEAAEWGATAALPETMESNFHEVANVLAKFATKGSERCVLDQIGYLPQGTEIEQFKDRSAWHTTLNIEIDGYPAGRIGFIAV